MMITKFKRVIAITASAIVLLGCKEQTRQMPPVAEYQMLKVSKQDCTTTKSSSTIIKGVQDVSIYPEVSGRLTKTLVEDGQSVKVGDVMFVIDQIPYKAALESAQASVAVAKSQLATAELTYNSKQQLFKDKVVSEFDLASAKNAYTSAQATLVQAQAQEVSARNNLSYTEVKSPCNGVINITPYDNGTIVSQAMSEPLTIVSDNSVMNAYFSINENDALSLLRKFGSKQSALESFPEVTLKLSDGSTFCHPGRVTSIGSVVDRNTGTVSIRADFPNPQGTLLSGVTGNIIIPTQHKEVIIIPQSTTFELQDKTFVYTIVDGKAKSKIIEVSRTDSGTEYIVESGLSEGDMIIAEGVGLLREGTPVIAKGSAPAAAPVSDDTKSDKE
ncbi:MAG: efflux RND transporter periplasmic adaptor subunit [Rikenellaceae bacterium]